MTEKLTHAPGTFCWPELSSTDQAGAEKFYSSLFGWTLSVTPMGPDSHYTIFQKNGKAVGAGAQMDPDMQKSGVPSNWLSYVSVANVDESVAKATSLGAKVVAGPFDVMEHGRMAVLVDPQGAAFALWQAKQHAGIELYGEPGALVWTELVTPDPKGAIAFYTALFPWTTESFPGGTMEYTLWKRGEDGVGGVMELTKEMKEMRVPPHWMVYFSVEDADAAVKKAESLGAKTLQPPFDVPGAGRMAVLKDPQGGAFSVIKTEPRM